MRKERQADSPFWSVAEEERLDLQNKQEAEQYGSVSPGLCYEEYMEKQTALNAAWNEKVPDDMIMMRYEIESAKYVYIGCTALYVLMTLSDGDATLISPLRDQIWPLVVISLLALLQYTVSRQYREVRWHAEEKTAVIYHKGILGKASSFIVSATKFERGDELSLNSEIHSWTNSDGEHKSSTSYWIELHRDGQQCDTFGADWNYQHQLLATVDFLQEKILSLRE
jgi:hypothetical protein